MDRIKSGSNLDDDATKMVDGFFAVAQGIENSPLNRLVLSIIIDNQGLKELSITEAEEINAMLKGPNTNMHISQIRSQFAILKRQYNSYKTELKTKRNSEG